MRKGLAVVGAVLISLSVAGCGGGLVGSEEQSPAEPSNSSAPAPSSETKESERTAPAKSLELADKCMIVSEEQAQSFGVDQPTELLESAGKQGCDYQAGQAGEEGGFSVFVATDAEQNLAEFKKERGSLANDAEVAGYPAAQVGSDGRHCLTSVDIADDGSLFLNALSRDGGPDPCALSKKFAEAAVKNLPDA